MTEETAKELAAAMRELSAALNTLPRGLGGITVQHSHSGLRDSQQNYWPQQYPPHSQWQLR